MFLKIVFFLWSRYSQWPAKCGLFPSAHCDETNMYFQSKVPNRVHYLVILKGSYLCLSSSSLYKQTPSQNIIIFKCLLWIVIFIVISNFKHSLHTFHLHYSYICIEWQCHSLYHVINILNYIWVTFRLYVLIHCWKIMLRNKSCNISFNKCDLCFDILHSPSISNSQFEFQVHVSR